ncbi:hypothetical protein [uncultured Brevundimonas sp.]|uniref:hypothetical protein n=1 Tax=uncultured Brevundimonas sp. TaxID=213418 RepID=UPI002627377D|nr:hypothetical protein [uncultured Brevundimonas sp.]
MIDPLIVSAPHLRPFSGELLVHAIHGILAGVFGRPQIVAGDLELIFPRADAGQPACIPTPQLIKVVMR